MFTSLCAFVPWQILQLAVLSILLTAPTGAALISVTGPLLLQRSAGADRLHRKSEIKLEDVEAVVPLQGSGGAAVGVWKESPGIEVTGVGRSGSLLRRSEDKRSKAGGEEEEREEEEDSAMPGSGVDSMVTKF